MKVGVIGLGEMGGGIAGNLLGKGFSTVVRDMRRELVDQFVKKGASAASSAKELGRLCDVVLTSLPMSPPDTNLEKAILGPDGILEGMVPSKVIIDCGNTSPSTTKKLSHECQNKGVSFLDAAVSGGPVRARAGTLAVYVGGPLDVFERTKDVFGAIAEKVTYFGPSGSGQMVKLINNMLCFIHMAAMSEAFVLGRKAGLDPVKLHESLSAGTGQSWVLDNFGKLLLERFPGQKSDRKRSHEKQLVWAFDIASELEVPIPVSTCVHELFKMAHAAGKLGSYEALIELWEDMTGVFFTQNAQ